MRKIQIALFVLLTFAAPAVLMAGYVWTADGSGAYSGTAAPWVSDAAVTGKLVNSGTENTFTADINVTGAENFTIAGPGVVVTTEKITRVEQGNQTTTFSIQDGAAFKTTNVISISDATGQSIGYINVDGGTIESSSEIRVGFHHHGYLNVTNGGAVTTTGNLTVGGLDTRKGIGHVTVGGADSDTNTGSIKAANINVGMSSPATTEMTVNNGTVSAATFTLGANTANTDGEVHDVILNINAKGTVTLSGNFSAANHAQKNALINIDGGTLNANVVKIGDTAGTASATVTNGGTLQGKEAIVIGDSTTGSVTLTSGGKIFGSSVAEGGAVTYKSLFLGGYVGTATTGAGTLTISGGSVEVNDVSIGKRGSGTITMDTGTVTAHGTVYLGVDGTGTFDLSGGTVNSGNFTVGSKGTLNFSGGTITGSGNFSINSGVVNVKDSTADAPAILEKEVVINTTGKMNVNSPLDFTANKTLTLNGSLDIGAGGKFTASSTNGQVFRAGQGTATPTLNIHDGGVLEIGGNTRFLMGDAATSIVTINVDGEGSLLKYAATQDCALGYHGTGKTTVSNGGEISTVNLQVGVNNNNVEGVVPSELTIVGTGSAVNATGTVSIGYTNQKGILNMNATNDGFGKITAGTFTRYTQKESEINLGIDHGVLMTENYPAAGYEIVKATTVNNWAVNNASVWETTVSGGTVTATLAENKKAGELENGTIDVTGDLKIAGWVDYTIPEGWNITMSFSGVTGDDEMENLANWINEGSGEMNFTPVGNTLNLFDVPAMSGILAWDFAGFNALYGANVALESISAYVPEPSAFLLLLLGVFALLRGRRFQRR
ncbi:MAG: PEP-CTERM sorting domain-containing protein [Thermoguttaceae bacterium]|nr:PEP-CTERM sorting domain-containing protein [Thermoguttaceae bacterium]